MNSPNTPTQNLVVSLLIGCLLLATSGCATIIRGRGQTVNIITNPADRTVYYQGRPVSHGQNLIVSKQFESPKFNVGTDQGPIEVQMTYDMDPWLIADAALLFVFIIPGVIALGVDAATGAWRNLHSPQIVYVPKTEE